MRRTYALSGWVELAKIFLPALNELEKVKNEKMQRLKNGLVDKELFSNVCQEIHHSCMSFLRENGYSDIAQRYMHGKI